MKLHISRKNTSKIGKDALNDTNRSLMQKTHFFKQELITSMIRENSFFENIGLRLKILRNMVNLSIEEFCERYNLHLDNYLNYESGRDLIPQSEAIEILTQMFIMDGVSGSLEWLYKEAEKPPKFREKPVKSQAQVKRMVGSKQANMLQLAYTYKEMNQNNIVAVVCDSFMGSFLIEGTIVAGQKYDLKNPKQLSNIQEKICIVNLKNSRQVIRLVSYIEKNGEGFLCCSTILPSRQNIFPMNKVLEIAEVNFAINKDTFRNQE